MKKLVLLCAVQLMFATSWSQLEDAQLDSLEKIWTTELKNEIVDQGIGTGDINGWSEFSDSVYNAYAKDTFLLNGCYSRHIDADQTDFGMVRATMEWEEGYDKLLNKYYQLLLKKLSSDADKQLLKQSQRNWIAFRDSERKLSIMLTEERYSGGGTIQNLIYSGWDARLTQKRVEDLIDYLTRLVE